MQLVDSSRQAKRDGPGAIRTTVADGAPPSPPLILYPYHYGDTDPARIVALLKDEKSIEVRVRKMK